MNPVKNVIHELVNIDIFSVSIIEAIVAYKVISTSSLAMWCSLTGHMTSYDAFNNNRLWKDIYIY